MTVNNAGETASFDLNADGAYAGALTGRTAAAENGRLHLEIDGNSGEIWIPQGENRAVYEPVRQKIATPEPPKAAAPADVTAVPVPDVPYDQMTVEQLQSAILAKLAANGPVTDRMRRDVAENVYRDSLLNWVKSFR